MKKYDFAKKKLMTPGPVPLPQYVRESLALYECHHRTNEFTEILMNTFTLLKKIFQTEEHCFLLSCTGTGAMEAALVNTLSTTSRLAYIDSGKFGERWGKMAKAYHIESDALAFPWGQDIDLNQVEKVLATGKYSALAFQACETSTGALLPTQELSQLCQKYNVLSIVDAITALGAVNIPMQSWGLDVLIAGSQKAFMLPTGMAFISLSKKAQGLESDLPKYYFNLAAEKKSNLEGSTRYSTPTHFIIALEMVLTEIIEKRGLQNHLKDIDDKANYFRSLLDLEQFPQTASPSLTCLKVPVGASAKKIKKQVAEDGYVIMSGQDHLADLVLRVGHMGEMSKDDLLKTALSIKSHLK